LLTCESMTAEPGFHSVGFADSGSLWASPVGELRDARRGLVLQCCSRQLGRRLLPRRAVATAHATVSHDRRDQECAPWSRLVRCYGGWAGRQRRGGPGG